MEKKAKSFDQHIVTGFQEQNLISKSCFIQLTKYTLQFFETLTATDIHAKRRLIHLCTRHT